MKSSNLTTGALKGRGVSDNTPIPGTVFRTGERLKISSVIPTEEASMNYVYTQFQYRPSMAVVATPYVANCFGIYSKNGELTHVIMAKEIHELCVFDVTEKKVYYHGSTTDESVLIPILAAELSKKDKLFKEWQTLDLSKAWDESHQKCFVEQDQKIPFGQVSSGLLYQAKKLADTLIEFEYKNGKVKEEEVAKYFKSINGDVVDLTPLFYTSNQDEWNPWITLQRDALPTELCPIFPVLRKKVKLFDAEPAQKKVKKDFRADFFAKDWSLMSDEEAKKLPEDLQASRDLCRQKYEEGKNYLTNKQLTWIKRFHKGTARSMLFLGDAGTGKTTTAQMIAGCLHLPMEHVIGDAESGADEYFGNIVLTVDENGNSKTVWADGPVTRAMRTGSLLLFDEVNICRPSVLASFHSILDGIRGITLKQKGEFVRANPHFLFIGTMNAGEGYEGTNKLNNAFVSRMDINTKFSPFSEEKAIEILKDETGYANAIILHKLMQVHDFIRKNLTDPMDQFTSIRQVISWIRQAEVTEEWIESSVDTILAPLMMNEDEDVSFEVDDILASDTFAGEALSFIKELLEGDEY